MAATVATEQTKTGKENQEAAEEQAVETKPRARKKVAPKTTARKKAATKKKAAKKSAPAASAPAKKKKGVKKAAKKVTKKAAKKAPSGGAKNKKADAGSGEAPAAPIENVLACLQYLLENKVGTRQGARAAVGEKRVGLPWLVAQGHVKEETVEGKIAHDFKITAKGKRYLKAEMAKR